MRVDQDGMFCGLISPLRQTGAQKFETGALHVTRDSGPGREGVLAIREDQGRASDADPHRAGENGSVTPPALE